MRKSQSNTRIRFSNLKSNKKRVTDTNESMGVQLNRNKLAKVLLYSFILQDATRLKIFCKKFARSYKITIPPRHGLLLKHGIKQTYQIFTCDLLV